MIFAFALLLLQLPFTGNAVLSQQNGSTDISIAAIDCIAGRRQTVYTLIISRLDFNKRNRKKRTQNGFIMSDDKNIWDDTLLIKAYDDSVSLARETLARRIADSTNRREEKLTEDEKKEEEATTTSEPELDQEEVTYKVGGFARATYTDGLDYEGTVVSIDEKAESCILRYVGYENEQEILLSDLLPSWGPEARKEQILVAKQAEAEQEKRPKHFKKTQTAPKVKKAPAQLPPGLNMPPMPLVPPMFKPNGGVDNEPEQDFVAMLTAWYMSGYYTGLYQGRKETKKNKK